MTTDGLSVAEEPRTRRRRRGDTEYDASDMRRVFLGWKDGRPRWQRQRLYVCGICAEPRWMPPVEGRDDDPAIGWVLSRVMWEYGYCYCPEHRPAGRAIDETMPDRILDMFHELVALERMKRVDGVI